MIRFRHIDAGPLLGRNTLFGLPGTLRAVLLATLLAPALLAGQGPPSLTWHGEVRPRLFSREPVNGEWDGWTSMRTRLGLEARFEAGLGLFIQVQDVRFWGEETSPSDRSADALDFHQAYLEVDSVPGIGGKFRIGRQEMALAEGRLIAAPNWGQGGQSFDGLRWTRPLGGTGLSGGAGGTRADLLYFRLGEESTLTHGFSADVLGGWVVIPVKEIGSLELVAIHQRTGKPGIGGQSTFGPIWKQSAGDFSLRLQGLVQTGQREGIGQDAWVATDVSAYLVAAQGTLSVLDGRGTVTLWYDRLSGDSDPDDGETGAFSTVYGARHQYYGRADYFLNIPLDTGGLGLQDAALKLMFRPDPLLSVNLDLHTFRTSQDGDLSSRHLAEEVDLWVRYRFREALALEAGYSLIRSGDALSELGRLDGTGTMAYLMSSLSF